MGDRVFIIIIWVLRDKKRKKYILYGFSSSRNYAVFRFQSCHNTTLNRGSNLGGPTRAHSTLRRLPRKSWVWSVWKWQEEWSIVVI